MNNENTIHNSPNIINLEEQKSNLENHSQSITQINTNENEKKQQSDDFVNSLPEWDLIPPYETVRRINKRWIHITN